MIGTRKSRRRAGRFLWATCAVLWATAFAATHTPAEKLPQDLPPDRVLHFLGYLVLSAMLLVTLAYHDVSRVRRAVAGLCVMVACAALDEITQSLIGRGPSFADWLTDVVGAAAGVVLVEIVLAVAVRRLRRRRAG